MDSSDLVIGTLRDGGSAASQAGTALMQTASGRIPWVIADDPLIQQIISDKALLSSVWSWLCQQVETCTDATLSPVGRPTNSSRALHVLSTGTASSTNPAFTLLERHAASLPDTPFPVTPLPPAIQSAQQGAAISVSAESLNRHAVIFGATGTGKSYLTYLLLREQLLRGCSLVAFDTKLTTIARLRGACHEAGIPAERVAVINPSDLDNVPGFNPFRAGHPPAQTVAQMLTLIELSNDGKSGPRMRQFLRNALVLVAWHNGTLLDVIAVLQDDGFRRRLLATAPCHPVSMQYQRSLNFFTHDFLRIAPSDRDSSIQAVANKFDEILGDDFFLTLVCATTNTIDLPRLFSERGAVLVHMDTGLLGESGAKLLSGMMAYYLQDAAMRYGGNGVPVVFSLDEIGTQSRFLDMALQDTTNMAREKQLRLLFATQHPGQLPPRLGQDLMENAAVKAFFRLGSEQARDVAQDLADADEPDEEDEALPLDVPTRYMEQPEICLRLRTSGPPRPVWSAPLYAFRYNAKTLSPLYLDLPQFNGTVAIISKPDPSDVVRPFVRGVHFQQPPVYVGESATRLTGLIPYLQRLVGQPARLVWQNRYGYVELSLPGVQAVIEPAPKVQAVPQARSLRPERRGKEHWVRTVRKLGKGEAVVQIQDGSPQVVRVTHIVPPVDAPKDYVACSQAAFRTETTLSFEMPEAPPPAGAAPQSRKAETRRNKTVQASPPQAPPLQPVQQRTPPNESVRFLDDDRSID